MFKVINFLEMTILKTLFLSSPVISVFLLVNVSNLSTCFKSFLSFLQLCLINTRSAKDADIRNICNKGVIIGSTYTRITCIESVCLKDIYIKGISFKNACIKSAGTKATYIKSTFVGVAYIKNICAGNTSIINHSKIHLQSFPILEVKLFQTGLENKARVG